VKLVCKALSITNMSCTDTNSVYTCVQVLASHAIILTVCPSADQGMSVSSHVASCSDAQVMDEYSSKSFRLLAMAVGTIPNAAGLDFAMMTQQQVEACAVHMQLLSLVVLTNNVRSDSKDTIAHLQDR